MKARPSTQAFVLFFGVAMIAGGALFARMGIQVGGTGFQLSLWRVTLASSLLLLFSFVRRSAEPAKLTREMVWPLLIAGVCQALHFLTWMESLRYIPVARSTLLVSTSPLFAGLAALFVPSLKPGKWFWWGLLLAFAGVLVFSYCEPVSTSRILLRPAWVGDVCAVAGAILVVPYLVYSQKLQVTLGTRRTVTLIYVCAALALWVGALAQRSFMPPPSLLFWAGAAGMAVFSQLMGHTSLNWSLKYFSPGQVTSATLLEPVFASLLAWALLGEAVTLGQAVGGAVLLAGVALTLRVEPSPE